MIWIIYLLQLLAGTLLLAFSFILLYSMLFGAPYAALSVARTKRLAELLNIKKGDLTLDLGAGDGRLVIEFAKKGATAVGFEINPILVLIANYKIKKAGLTHTAKVLWKDFWQEDISKFNKITIYLSFNSMGRLEKKIQKEAKRGTRIGVNYFKFPSWKEEKKEGALFIYKK